MTHRINHKVSEHNIDTLALNDLERHLLNDFQKGFPLSATPYADMAAQLGVTEQNVIDTLQKLKEQGAISRVGAVFRPNRVGASTLAAMAVPPEKLLEVAALVNEYEEVNHNYEREHDFNLWFVATARNEAHLKTVLDEIETRSGFSVLYLPLLEDYHIDLGFELKWS